jgi:hypothetical protein
VRIKFNFELEEMLRPTNKNRIKSLYGMESLDKIASSKVPIDKFEMTNFEMANAFDKVLFEEKSKN